MRNPERIDTFIDAVKEIWKEAPDLRFGQLVSNLYFGLGRDIFYVEDDEFEKLLSSYKGGKYYESKRSKEKQETKSEE